MPTISVDKDAFYKELGRTYSEQANKQKQTADSATDEFFELMFAYGLELDEDTSQTAPNELPHKLKIEIPANRYDLLCFEGLARALNIYLGRQERPNFKVLPWNPSTGVTVKVSKEVQQIRPYFASAILRNVNFDAQRYASFIDLQDKLHMNLARRRTLVAIGTHDLEKIAPGTITYEALPPSEIKFQPLNKEQAYTATEMMQLYETDRHLNKFLPIIRDSPVYPIIYDSTRQVLSMPPIINSEHTKITLETKNIFIDTTAIDQTKLSIVINMIVTMFSQYTTPEPFTIEPVKVFYEADGRQVITPDLSARPMTVDANYINNYTALKLSPQEICDLLCKMGNEATVNQASTVTVQISPTRPDILHPCDLVEDAAIAYGFDNLVKTFPTTNTVARPQPVSKLTDILRRECAQSGWVEVLPLILCSHDEAFAWLNRKDDGKTAVVLANPKTAEYQIVRTTLLSGILKSIRENRKHSLPMRLFEVSDVAVKDPSQERQSRNIRKLAAVYVGRKAGFEIVHGLLDRLMLVLGVKLLTSRSSADESGYYIRGVDDETYFPGRSAKVYYRAPSTTKPQSVQLVNPALESAPEPFPDPEAVAKSAKAQETPKQGITAAVKSAASAISSALSHPNDVEIGNLGILHPSVLHNFEIDAFACSAIELDLEVFL